MPSPRCRRPDSRSATAAARPSDAVRARRPAAGISRSSAWAAASGWVAGSSSLSNERGGGSHGCGGQRLCLAPERAVERIDYVCRHPGNAAPAQAGGQPSSAPMVLRPSRSSVRTAFGSSCSADTEQGGKQVRQTLTLPRLRRGSLPLPRAGEGWGEGFTESSSPRRRRRSVQWRPASSGPSGQSGAAYRAARPRSPPNRCATPLTSSLRPPSQRVDPPRPTATSGRPSAQAARPAPHRLPGRPEARSAPGSSARASVSRAPARAPRSAAALVTAWMIGPCVPSTVRTIGVSGP